MNYHEPMNKRFTKQQGAQGVTGAHILKHLGLPVATAPAVEPEEE